MLIVGQKVRTKSLMAALLDCFTSSSCLILHEYWNSGPNNNNIGVKEAKIWLTFKTWCSLFVPRHAAILSQRKLSMKILMPVYNGISV